MQVNLFMLRTSLRPEHYSALEEGLLCRKHSSYIMPHRCYFTGGAPPFNLVFTIPTVRRETV